MTCLAPHTLDLPVIATLVVFGASAIFAIWVWRNHQFAGKRALIAAEYGMLWWLLAAAMELSSESLGCKLFWSQAAWPGIILMPSAWAMFLFHYAIGNDTTLPRLKHFSLWIGPSLIGLVAFSNDFHHLLYTENTYLAEVNGRISGVYDHGPLFYIAVSYVYAFMLATVGIGITAMRRAMPALRPFFVMLLVITLIPIAANLAYILGGVTLFGFDPTPFMFSFVLIAFGWLAVSNRMMDITAIARDLLFRTTDSPILIFDDEGVLSGMNASGRTLLHHKYRKIGTNLRALPKIGPLISHIVLMGQLPKDLSITWDGQTYDPRLTPLPSPINPDGPAVGWTLVFINVSQQKAQADLLAKAAETAEAANDAKSDFLSTVSHELRTPLTSIQGALDIVQMTSGDKLPEQTAQLIAIASNNTRRLKILIDDLLDLQKMEQGLMEFQMESLDLVPLIQEAVTANQGYLDGYGIKAHVDLPQSPCRIMGDQKRLMQVMANLLSNAAKFSDNGKTVDIALRQDKDHITIKVKDHGIGIPPGSEDKVFGRFSQVNAAATRAQGGSGLGLNITQEILEAHKGTIRYDSKLGQGTTFIVSLPVA